MRSIGVTIIFLFALLLQCKAQQAKAFTFQWKVNAADKESVFFFQNDKSVTMLPGETTQRVSFFSPLQPIKYTLPKGAIFCRMEDALYKHFNVLIKVRMGTDDRYSN